MSSIRASVLHGAKDLKVETRTIEPPAPTDLQVAVRSTGLCGSDLHYYHHYRNGDIICREPMSLGHESAGVVVDIGSAVTGFKVGDKVALEVGLPCGECERCKEGRYNICKGMKFRSSAKAFPHAQGTLQDRINHPAAWCHKLPDDMSLDLGAILEPLGVAIHAVRRAQLPPQSTVLVFGAGAVGLLAAAMAKISGASNVVIADIDAGRVDFAVQNGFAHKGYTVPMKRGKTIEENLEIAKETAAEVGKVQKTTGEPVGEVDAVFECTGVPSCVQAGIYACRPGGRLMLIGMGTPVQTLPISAAALREVDIVGVFRYANTYPTGIEVVSEKGPDYPDFSKLVTHRYKGLDEIPKAFEMAGKTKDEDGKLVLKVVIEMDDGGRARL
ncbi:sorbitol dehydrogenase-like protein [Saccharata proteae CBS 121410]|uniref:Sorbitol dehydrogenase-like protein n=1 Tax=Saccharata proteae CBS 121410 TaxID=1314787 RepID=A0A9P4LYT4_9PEZI|nr:sorbitol dehydrogenase-like protein [Saccharata proteae CBS 121410]